MADKRAPIPVPPWEDADAYAIQALNAGKATPEQQMRAMKWIIYGACATYDFCTNPESDRLSAIFDGRRFAGLQIVKLATINMEDVKKAAEVKKKIITSTSRSKNHA